MTDDPLAGLGIPIEIIQERRLTRCPEAKDLVVAQTDGNGRTHLLVPSAARAWRRMKARALEDGIDLHIVSAFRSVARQREILRRKLGAGQSIESILAVSAPPGYSEHHSGRAVDVGTGGVKALEPGFEESPAFAWLRKRAGAFGFSLSYPPGNPQGYAYEPWHWCHASG